MAYHSDPDGPVVDRGALRARILEVCGIVLLAFIVVFIIGKVRNRKSKRIESAINSSKIDLKYSPYNYSFSNSDDSVEVSLWGDGLTAVSRKAFDGDPESKVEWRKIKDNVLSYVNELDINFSLERVDDIEITVKLVGENDHSLVLLVFKNTENIYDIVRDIGG
jgi:hypothetical protein